MPGAVPARARQYFQDANGKPLAGGSVEVLHAGTTDPLDSYQDQGLSILNENPVPLDARGECVIYLTGLNLAKFVVRDALGVFVYEEDPVLVGGDKPLTPQLTVDYFDGDGAQTAFTLSVPPTSENNTFVHIGGTYVPKSAYSVAGSIITFAVAPAVGTDNIEVQTIELVEFSASAALISEQADAAAASAEAAADSENAAAASAADAADSLTAAEDALADTEVARDSALAATRIYADTTAGLAAVASGEYFYVPSTVLGESLILYKDNAGVAVEVKRYPDANAIVGLRSAMMLLQPGAALPTGWRSTGDTVNGVSIITPNIAPDMAEFFNAGQAGVAIFPGRSRAWQNWNYTTPATADGDLIKVIEDISPNRRAVVANSDTARPTLRYTGGGVPYIEVDNTTNTDRFHVPKRAVNRSVYYVCVSLELRTLTGAAFPTVFGDFSTTSGLFCGFSSLGVLRLACAGGTAGTVTASGPGAIALATRTTIEYLFSGTELVIWQDGVEKARVAAVGTFGDGLQPQIGYSTGSIRSPLNIYGLIAIGKNPTDNERAAMRALVSGDNLPILNRQYLEDTTAAAERSVRDVAVADMVRYAGAPAPTLKKVYMLGDSTSADFNGLTNVLSYVNTRRTKVNVAVAGNTLAQQKTAWNNLTIVAAEVESVCLGPLPHNNLDPANGQSVAQVIAAYQDLVDTIRSEVGSAPILVCGMIPCDQRLTNLYAATTDGAGLTAHQRFDAIQEAIFGNGATPITGVQARVTAHVALLDDGTGKLLSDYDTFFDGIHENDFARKYIIAPAIEAQLTALGVGY